MIYKRILSGTQRFRWQAVALIVIVIQTGCASKTDTELFLSQVHAVREGRSDRIDLLGHPGIAPEDLAMLAGLSELKWLRLDGVRLTDKSLQHLSSLSQLETLFLAETQISNEGLKSLAHLKSLRNLVLDTTPISDDGLIHLSNLPELESLSLWNCFVTDRGCKTLASFPSLKDVSLDGTQISDTGLRQLSKLKDLSRVSLWQTKVTDRGIRELAKKHPKVTINQ